MKKIFSMFLIVLSIMLMGCSNIYQHTHITCQECGKCIAEDCNGLEEEKCQGHQIVHNHIECEECGKCISDSCDGLEEERCKGHEENHNHIPCQDCGKCIAEDCNGLEEEKCQGHQVIHEHIECEECGKCIAEDCDGLEEEKCQGCIIINLVDKIYVSFINYEFPVKYNSYIMINTYQEYIDFVNSNSLMEIKFGYNSGYHYEDEYYSVLLDYDEKFFEKNSLLFCFMGIYHSRQKLSKVYDVEFNNGILQLHCTMTNGNCNIDFTGKIFYSVELSKKNLTNELCVQFIYDKFA